MNGFFLVIPILLIRYGAFPLISREAFRRASFFPPTAGVERVAYWVNCVAGFALMLVFILYKAHFYGVLGFAGLGLYIAGAALYLVSVVQYAKPGREGLNTTGLYKVSRNPMYVAFFICFLGCAMIARSLPALGILIVFQAATHYLILSEERWCIEHFGSAYKDFMKRVRRYL